MHSILRRRPFVKRKEKREQEMTLWKKNFNLTGGSWYERENSRSQFFFKCRLFNPEKIPRVVPYLLTPNFIFSKKKKSQMQIKLVAFCTPDSECWLESHYHAFHVRPLISEQFNFVQCRWWRSSNKSQQLEILLFCFKIWFDLFKSCWIIVGYLIERTDTNILRIL